ncbi:MAG: HAD-IIIA family hydrolase [Deltaproteobacteria bacterium]|nr:HAD-IIIA family hydrolase [Deltaproteobacteria bacterium]
MAQALIPGRSLIVLDRDGVLNELVVDPEHGTIDSPLHPDQVTVPAFVPRALLSLTTLGFSVVVVTNQPAAAKGKATRDNLLRTHERVLREASALGGRIAASFVCWHRAEDGCGCRKPKPGLIQEAFALLPAHAPSDSVMIGDGISDIEAGQSLAMKTVLIGPRKLEHASVFMARGVMPALVVSDLLAWVETIRASES